MVRICLVEMQRMACSTLCSFRSHSERGITTVIVLLILLVLSLIGIAGMTVSTTEIRIAGNQYRSTQALHAADAGRRVATDAVVAQVRGPQGHPAGNPMVTFTLTSVPAVIPTGFLPSGPGGAAEVAYTISPVSREGLPYYPPVSDFRYLDYTIHADGSGPFSTQKGVDVVAAVLYQEGYEWP